MSKVHVYYFLGPCSIFFSSEKQKSNFLCEYTCSCIIQIEWFVYNKKDRLLQKLFTRNSVKNILSIIVNFVRDIFARFPRAWSSRISLNANQFSINCLCIGNYFQKIMIEKLVYQNFVHREIKSARIRTHACMDTNELSKMNVLNFA